MAVHAAILIFTALIAEVNCDELIRFGLDSD